ncbi:MAG: (NiFe) hydrogenase maturation protein HypF [Pedosphaera sp.]|nr:(NiFe) hydrogenase maturation protein HypF [Pedosphaera sp.]
MKHERARVALRGAVQGVGFRPFVYRLAMELQLSGWVLNSAQGVQIEVEGERKIIDQFLIRLEQEKPPRSAVMSLECSFLDAVGYGDFEIRFSEERGETTVLIMPDSATCTDCLRDIFDEQNRRHRYPFTNCTNCGPRFTIIEDLPYDRKSTTMRHFAMCPECDREYHDPRDRRFQAQPNACPKCGPHLELWNTTGNVVARHNDALLEAAECIRNGKIVAIKGLGGFQLVVDARDEAAVRCLRDRKHREEKPFAVMCPALEFIRRYCEVSLAEARLLSSPEAPIVLLERRLSSQMQDAVAPSVAPNNPCLGVMLPYTPLHHLLLHELDFPIVATSGNLSGEPICTDEREALERLQGIADFFLVHDRPIVRHVDDSVARVLLGREQVLRRSRGYAPLPVHSTALLPTVLAVGAHQKNAIALSVGHEIFISQHIGDLETRQAHTAFCKVIADFQRVYGVEPEITARDLHPDYLSSKLAQESRNPVMEVQHHHAHVLACMAENELEAPVLGVAWDGTGFGTDGTIWGGEFLLVNEESFRRVAYFRHFRLPGGEACIQQPRRTAMGLLYEIFGDSAFELQAPAPLRNCTEGESRMLRQMLARGINSPITSSAGRLFDAVASLAGLRQKVGFEGQAAMELEFAVQRGIESSYLFDVSEDAIAVVDWQPMILQILDDIQRGLKIGIVAAQFHNTLAEVIVNIAQRIGQPRIALSGGCFQNKHLTEQAVRRLQRAGFQPYWHQRVPPNDGGIALGQIMAAVQAMRSQAKTEELCAH